MRRLFAVCTLLVGVATTHVLAQQTVAGRVVDLEGRPVAGQVGQGQSTPAVGSGQPAEQPTQQVPASPQANPQQGQTGSA